MYLEFVFRMVTVFSPYSARTLFPHGPYHNHIMRKTKLYSVYVVKETIQCGLLVLKAQGELILMTLTSSQQMSEWVFWEEL